MAECGCSNVSLHEFARIQSHLITHLIAVYQAAGGVVRRPSKGIGTLHERTPSESQEVQLLRQVI